MKTFKERVEQLKAKGHGEGKYLLQAIPNNEAVSYTHLTLPKTTPE